MYLEFSGQYSLSEIFVIQYGNLFSCFQAAEDHVLFMYCKLARAYVGAKVPALSARESGRKDELELTRKYPLLMDESMR